VTRRASDTPAIVEQLVKAGAPLNSTNRFQRTPLHECVIVENREAAEKLVAAGADVNLKEKEGKTAWQLAFARDCYTLADLLGQEQSDENLAAQAVAALVRAEENLVREEEGEGKEMSVEEEKDALKRRLAELEEGERQGLESRISSKKSEIARVKEQFRSQREETLQEIERLQDALKVLQEEEARKVAELEQEVTQLGGELKLKSRAEGGIGTDLEELLLCPVCLDIAKPPLQVWQCPEGHIICGSCADRPELLVCPQCRVSLAGMLSRNRALEDLSRRTFPREAEAAALAAARDRERGRGEGSEAGRANNTGSNVSSRATSSRGLARGGGQPRAGRAGRRQQPASQVDQNIDFRYLLAPRTDPRALLQATPGLVSPPPPGLLPPGLVSASSDEEGGYDLTSEVFLENVDEEFMPNFPQPDATVRSGAGSGSTRSAALVQRMNSFRLGTSPRHTHNSPRHAQRRHRRSSPVPPTRAARSGAGPRGMVDPRGALEDEEEEEDEGGEDWEDMPERDSGRFDMVMNMIPGEHSKHPLTSVVCIAASGNASGGSRASRSSDRAGRRGRGRYQGLADFAANLRPARNMR